MPVKRRIQNKSSIMCLAFFFYAGIGLLQNLSPLLKALFKVFENCNNYSSHSGIDKIIINLLPPPLPTQPPKNYQSNSMRVKQMTEGKCTERPGRSKKFEP